MERRRSAPRIRVTNTFAGIQIRKSIFRWGREERVTVWDMGPKGMSFRRTHPAPPGSHISFSVDIQDKPVVRGTGTLKNYRKAKEGEETFILGIEFTKLSQESLDFLGYTRNILEISGNDCLDRELSLQNRIKEVRSSIGLTKTELASISGLSPVLVNRIEEGNFKDLSSVDLYRLAKGMGVTMEDLSAPQQKAAHLPAIA